MKSIATCVVLAVVLALPGVARADETERAVMLPREVLAEIRQSQGVPVGGKIDCDKVTPEQYEVLGEAVMEQSYASHEDHEWMDEMMGGDDSPYLQAMHRSMGARYLGCSYGGRAGSYFAGSSPGMMGGGYGPMHGWDDYPPIPGTSGWLWAFVLVVLVVLGLVAFVLVLTVRLARAHSAAATPLEILKRRYVSGELPQADYERLRNELR